MSLSSRLSSLVRSAAGSPTVRRVGRDLTRAAVRAVRDGKRSGGASPRRGTAHEATVENGQDRRTAGSPRRRAQESATTTGGREDLAAAALTDRRADRPVAIEYAPHDNDRPDPGEIVWGWVPYEEDISRGKDRPVLVLAIEDAADGGTDGSGEVAVALMFTSRDRADAGSVVTDEHGSVWVDIGSGGWDRQGRPSEVRADRLLRIPAGSVRREGARLDRSRFDAVADAVRSVHGW